MVYNKIVNQTIIVIFIIIYIDFNDKSNNKLTINLILILM